MSRATVSGRTHRTAASIPPGRLAANCAPNEPNGPAQLAWDRLFELLTRMRERLMTIASDLGLSLVQAHVLRQLQPGQPAAMSALADALACDNSNVTGLVDRLEARELIRRQAATSDRRVKQLLLTREGERVRARLLARMAEPPPELALLSAREQQVFSKLLERMLRPVAEEEAGAGATPRRKASATRRR